MENKKQGYKVRKYQGPVKRYCQMLNLKNDAALIAEYRKRHSEGKVWPETLASFSSATNLPICSSSLFLNG